tara:strand:+ start:2921 stop:3910 length:990 start_codon:yes stop_codon:yes gene_type:complete
MSVNFNNKTILITGGAGFIGSNIAFYLQNNYPESRIVVFDIFKNENLFNEFNIKSYGHYKNLIGFKGDIICGDITNDEDLEKIKHYELDYIFHLAAISDTRINKQEIVLRTNVNSFFKLIHIAINNNAKIVYASSASTYGSSPSPQKIGDDAPNTLYGFSKYAMSQIAHRYIKEKNMQIVGLKFFNVYGEREFFKEKTSSMILQLGHQILAGKSPRLFTGSSKIIRDFVYIKDVVNASILACYAKKSGLYNIGTSLPCSFRDIVDILQQELKTDLEIEYFDNPYSAYQMDTSADISLSQEFLGYNPKYTLEQGIKEYIPYIKQTFNWKN